MADRLRNWLPYIVAATLAAVVFALLVSNPDVCVFDYSPESAQGE